MTQKVVKVSLEEFYSHFCQNELKNDAEFEAMPPTERIEWAKRRMSGAEYWEDNWFRGWLPVDRLVIAHPDFQTGFEIAKEQTFVSEWPAIKPLFIAWLEEKAAKPGYFPIHLEYLKTPHAAIRAREDARPELYRVWDGQRRVLSALLHGVTELPAYIYPNRQC